MTSGLQPAVNMLTDLETALGSVKLMNSVADDIQLQDTAAWNWIIDHYYPPPRKPGQKFRFGSEKSRRWFWWRVRLGHIKVPYKRNFGLLDATDVLPIDVTASGFTLAVVVDKQKAPGAEFVVGERQVPGHADTGWPKLMTEVVLAPQPVALMAQLFASEYTKKIGGVIRGEAL